MRGAGAMFLEVAADNAPALALYAGKASPRWAAAAATTRMAADALVLRRDLDA